MFFGLECIIARKTMCNEFGIYRMNEDKQMFLMVACNRPEDAIKYGAAWAEAANVPFQSRIDISEKTPENIEPTKQTQPTYDEPKKRTRVTGVEPQVQKLIQEGMDDNTIVEAILPMYLAAGKPETSSRNYLFNYVKIIRKKGA